MFELQYNRNTFNPASRKDWQHVAQFETREQCEIRRKENCKKFKNEFGKPNDLQYRIIKIK